MADTNTTELVLLDKYSAKELARLREKVDTFRGPGVINTHKKITLVPAPPQGQGSRPTGAPQTLPAGQYQYMVFQMVTQNVAGWDWTRGHPLL